MKKKTFLTFVIASFILLIFSVPAFSANLELSQEEIPEILSDNSADILPESEIDYEYDELTVEDNHEELDIEENEQENEADDEEDEEDDEYEIIYSVKNVVLIDSKTLKVIMQNDRGYTTTHTLNNFFRKIKEVAFDNQSTVWILSETNELHAWNPNIDKSDLIPYAYDSLQLVKDSSTSFATSYISTKSDEVKKLGSFEELISLYEEEFDGLVLKEENSYGFYDYIFVNDMGYKEESITQISKRKYIYDEEKVRGRKFDIVTFNEYGEIIALNKKKVFILTENKRDKYVFKCFAKKIQELHINPQSGIAEYIVSKDGKIIECEYDS